MENELSGSLSDLSSEPQPWPELLGQLPANTMSDKLSAQLALLYGDPEFVKRALKFSGFQGPTSRNEPFLFTEARNSSAFDEGQEISLGYSKNSISGYCNEKTARKRVLKGERKAEHLSANAIDVKAENSSPKRCRIAETNGQKTEQNRGSSQKEVADKNAKSTEPPKDYVHVRARRGQATDSHSLAERVRREKISQKMKALQNLVPGCSKISGKAVMLDEIINYVQSLQQQVEFLSMKLATVNTQLELKTETVLPRDLSRSCSQTSQQQRHPLDCSSTVYSYNQERRGTPHPGLEMQCSFNPFSLGIQLSSLDVFSDANSQLGNIWEDDLQSVVQMNFHGFTQLEDC